jgi:hypothetical protein
MVCYGGAIGCYVAMGCNEASPVIVLSSYCSILTILVSDHGEGMQVSNLELRSCGASAVWSFLLPGLVQVSGAWWPGAAGLGPRLPWEGAVRLYGALAAL